MRPILRRVLCAATAVGLVCAPVGPAGADETPAAIGGPRMGEPGLVLDPAAPGPPGISAPSWVVADADTGAVLAAQAPHRPARPASTQKTLLALTMAPRLDPAGSYVTQAADTEAEGSRVGLVTGQRYSFTDLWYGMFLRSGNDIATAIARAGADGDVEKAVRMMQAEAHRLQALDTTVVNPSGLDADGQYSSAYDLALWGRAALDRGDIRRWARELRRDFPGNQTATATAATSKPFTMYTTNRLINRYDGAIGVKTGYTTLAHNTLIAAAQRDGRTILVTLMGVRANVTAEARQLLDWGFTNPAAAPVGVLVDPLSPAVLSTEDPERGQRPSEQLTQATAPDPLLVGRTDHRRAVGGVIGTAAAGLVLLHLRRRSRRTPAGKVILPPDR